VKRERDREIARDWGVEGINEPSFEKGVEVETIQAESWGRVKQMD